MSNASNSPGNEVRVLIVEDHEATRYAYSGLMRQRGYLVTEAANATEGLAAADANQPHCILLDLGLPDMDGASLAKLLRDRLGANLVLIAITGIPDRPVHDAAEAAGVDYLFQKPLDVDRLARILPAVS